MKRVMVVTTTTGYQVGAFVEAAKRTGIELVIASDRCHVLDDPWRDQALPVRFEDLSGAATAIVDYARAKAVAAIIPTADRPAVVAALAATALLLPSNRATAAECARNKFLTKQALRAAQLPVPEFLRAAIDCDEAALAREVQYPCVLKPLVLSASRGVIRANNEQEFTAAFDRVRRLLRRPEVARLKDPALEYIQVERFIAGREFALEGLLTRGHLQVLALFDKPDPLDGPLFEESIYTTPSRVSEVEQQRIARAVAGAIRAIGLEHGPVHAEARANQDAVYVLEVAARPIGGLCTRALRFTRGASNVELISLEELLLRHSVVEVTTMWQREARASGVMMIPIERSGILAGVEGEEQARAVAGVETVEITAKLDQELEALPESATYLGFIFARAKTAEEVEAALREAYSKLRFRFSEKLPLASGR